MRRVGLFLIILQFSVTQYQSDIKLIINEDNCAICDKASGITSKSPRCAYCGEIDDNLINTSEHQDNYMNENIENMLQLYFSKAFTSVQQECVPIISKYTNCAKDNINIGCKVCSCNVFGRWNCSFVEQCVENESFMVDHRTVVMAIEKLKEYKNIHINKRSKRSTNYDKINIHIGDLIKWIYGVKDLEENKHKNSPNVPDKQPKTNVTAELSTSAEYDIINSDESLYAIIAKEGNKIDNNKRFVAIDNDSFDKIKVIDNLNITDRVYLKVNQDMTNMTTVNIKVSTDKNLDTNEINRILRKREAFNTNDTRVTTIKIDNTLKKLEDLQKSILSSLNKILMDKQKELEQLSSIKEKILLYTKSDANTKITDEFIIKNRTNNSSNGNNFYIYFYQLNHFPREDFRKHDRNIREKYLNKLKRDIYEVIKDFAGIQRLSNSSIPYDLKILIRAMKYYVNKENERKKSNVTKHNTNHRRNFDINNSKENDAPLDILINILETLDNNATTDDVFEFISRDARKILNRVIKIFSRNDDLTNGSYNFNLQLDIVNKFRSIGSKWQELSLNFTKISIFEHLHYLKLLHIALSKDICELNTALKLIHFPNSRRTGLVDEILEKNLIIDMANNLNSLKNTLTQNMKLHHSKDYKIKSNKVKGKSLYEKIKKMVRASKREIQNLFHKNVSKTDIVKIIARRKLDEIEKKKINEYEEIVQRWQRNLNMADRRKRSAGEFQTFMNKIKHIVPSYLRSKKKRNKTRKNTRKNKHRRRASRGENKLLLTTSKVNIERNHN